jgi:ATP-dependent Lhr-like helicase
VQAAERHGVPWRELLRVLRLFELRGEVRGGRFVSSLSGEQYALPIAIESLRGQREERGALPPAVDPRDPIAHAAAWLLAVPVPDSLASVAPERSDIN